MNLRPVLCFAMLLGAAGCNGDKESGGDKPAATVVAPVTAPAPAMPAPVQSAATKTPAPLPAVTVERTPEPALAEWAKAREIAVRGSTALNCETRLVREWLRVMCVSRPGGPEPVSIEIVKGRKPGERSAGDNLKARNGVTTLVTPVVPGTDFEATFSWTDVQHALGARWPAGTGEDRRLVAFDPDSGDEPAAVMAPPSPSAKPAAPASASAAGAAAPGAPKAPAAGSAPPAR